MKRFLYRKSDKYKMLESLLPETKDLIQIVEKESNLKIRIEPSETQYLSKTLLSDYLRNQSNEITLSYNPSVKVTDYAIAHEAARYVQVLQDDEIFHCLYLKAPRSFLQTLFHGSKSRPFVLELLKSKHQA